MPSKSGSGPDSNPLRAYSTSFGFHTGLGHLQFSRCEVNLNMLNLGHGANGAHCPCHQLIRFELHAVGCSRLNPVPKLLELWAGDHFLAKHIRSLVPFRWICRSIW